MKQLKVLVALITEDNDYQREQASVARTTAERLGMTVDVVYAGGDAIAQTQQILAAIQREDHPDAVIVEPVGTGMLQVAKSAAYNGVGWVVLNREADYLAPLRQEASVPIGSVACDNEEVGRIQGRQFGALLPAGGLVLYMEGPAGDTAKQRRTGMEETLPANIRFEPVRGKWTEESALQAVSTRLHLYASRPPNVGVFGCQNDAMALGARKAVEAVIESPYREQWLKVPFTGVDGVPTTGLTWVQQRLLAATVITPALTGLALELLAKAIGTGTPIPERTYTKATSYPPVEELRAKAAAGH
jgi:ABC-type sugar transport system substrate-binding protein